MIAAGVVFGIHDVDDLTAFYDNGHGLLAALPLGLQAGVVPGSVGFRAVPAAPLVPPRRLLEISRRPSFVRGPGLDFGGALPSGEFAPGNHRDRRCPADGGHFTERLRWVGPFNMFHSAFVHANLSWSLGPFRYVLATPIFHRWHHTSREEGGNTNFAGTFPLWDILFGTFRMPKTGSRSITASAKGRFPSRVRRTTGLSVPALAWGRTSKSWSILGPVCTSFTH